MRSAAFPLVLAVSALVTSPAAAWPGGPVAQQLGTADAVIVRYEAGVDAGERAAARRRADVRRTGGLGLARGEVVEPEPGTSVRDAVTALERRPEVRYAEPDHPRRAFRTPDDRFFAQQWGLSAIRAPEAWDVTTGGEVLVGVVDSGTDLTHPDLVANLWSNPGEAGALGTNGVDDDGNGVADDVRGADFVQDGAQPHDANGHGTHVAGTVAAAGNNATGVAGVAWTADLASVRVLDGQGRGTVSDLVAGYRYADRIGVRVVNASLGGDAPSRAEREAIAAAPGVLFVVAAGNDGVDTGTTPSYPCSYGLANVLCVAASGRDDALMPFSNSGARSVDLAAPGVGIGSTWPGGRYAALDGTSMAAPHVAGAAVLALGRDPTLTAAELRRAIVDSARRVPALAGRVASGGRLDAAALITSVPLVRPVAPPAQTGPDPVPPERAPPPPPPPAETVVEPEPARPTAAPDTRAPGLGVTAPARVRRSTLVRRGLSVRALCSEACTVRFALRAAGRTVTATAQRPTAGALVRRLRASARTRAGRATLTVTATDAAGNRRTRALSVTILR